MPIHNLTAGQVQLLVETLASGMQQARNGQAVALAVSSPQRLPSAPDVPTVAESGVPGFTTSAWFGLVVPARTPDEVVARLHRAVRAAAADPAFQARNAEIGVDVVASSPEGFGRLIAEETATTREVVRRGNIRVE